MRLLELDPQARLRLVLGVVDSTAALVLAGATTLAIRQGDPGWARLGVVLAVALLVSAFPIEIGVGATKALYNLGELALIVGFVLDRPLWLVPTLTVARLLPPLFCGRLGGRVAVRLRAAAAPGHPAQRMRRQPRQQPPARAVLYAAAVRCLAATGAVLAATALTPGQPRLVQPQAFVQLVVAGVVFAAVSHLLSVAAMAASRELPYWHVFVAGLRAERLVATGNIVAGITILSLARWQPAAVVTLPIIYLTLRHFYLASQEAGQAAQLAGRLAFAQERLALRLPARQVTVVLAEEALRLTSAQQAHVTGPADQVLATAGSPNPPSTEVTLQMPLRDNGQRLGELTLIFSTPGQPTEAEKTALTSLTATAAAVWTSALLHERVRYEATHDLLTGLPNRQQLAAAIPRLLRGRSGHQRIAGLLIDLDRFKQANDTLGHPAGDTLLVQVAERLRGAVRDQDVVGRLAGDEFVVILPGLPPSLEAAQAAAVQVADRIMEALTGARVQLADVEWKVGASIGIIVYPDNGTNLKQLYERADTALREAKRNGRARIACYNRSREVTTIKRLGLEKDLKAALDAEDQLLPHYQLQYDLYTGKPLAAETFIRWQHPRYGLLPTTTMTAVANTSGLQHQLTRHTLAKALLDRRTWLQVTGVDLPVVVNLTRRDLLDHTTVTAVDKLLSEHTTPPARVGLEVCETDAGADLATVTDVLTACAQLGVGLSLDHFGVAGAALQLLASLPIDEVKLDPLFLSQLDSRPGSQLNQPRKPALVQAMIEAANRLGIRTAAQGIVNAGHLDLLRKVGCQAGQGPGPDQTSAHASTPQPAAQGGLFSAPVDLAELVEVLSQAMTESHEIAGTVVHFGQARFRE